MTSDPHHDGTGPDESVTAVRLPDIIDGWVRDGLVSAHSAMRVFSSGDGVPDAHGSSTTTSRFRADQLLGYAGASIVSLGGLLVLMDDRVSPGSLFLIGALILIALRQTMRPTHAARRFGSPPTAPRHRSARRTIRRSRS